MTRAPAVHGPTEVAGGSFAVILERARRTPREPIAARDPWVETCRVETSAPRDATPAEGMTGAAASLQLDRIAALAHVDHSVREVTVGVSSELGLRLARTDAGVTVVLEAAPQRTSRAEEQLRAVVRTLRAHGVSVARASVRAVLRPTHAR